MVDPLIIFHPPHLLLGYIRINPVYIDLLLGLYLKTVLPSLVHTFQPKSLQHTFLSNGYSVLLISILMRGSFLILRSKLTRVSRLL